MRMGYAAVYTPNDTVQYEERVKWEYIRQCGKHRFDDGTGLVMHIKAYYPIPKRTTVKNRLAMLNEANRPLVKPDADNVLKIIADSLNGLAYKDDAQIVDVRVVKFYGDCPRVEVEVGATCQT
jgi:Holliday junction resolvase RusA-like endonuclease